MEFLFGILKRSTCSARVLGPLCERSVSYKSALVHHQGERIVGGALAYRCTKLLICFLSNRHLAVVPVALAVSIGRWSSFNVQLNATFFIGSHDSAGVSTSATFIIIFVASPSYLFA